MIHQAPDVMIHVRQHRGIDLHAAGGEFFLLRRECVPRGNRRQPRRERRILADDAQFLHPLQALRTDGIVAPVINALVFVQPVVRRGEGRMHRLEAKVGEEGFAVRLVLLVALDDEVRVGLR